MSKRSSETVNESLGYSVRFSQSASLDKEKLDGSRYVVEVVGSILHHTMNPAGDTDSREVGTLKALRFQMADAMESGVLIYDCCDEHSSEAVEYAAAVLQQDANEFHKVVEETCGDFGFGCDVLAIVEMKLDSAHRGKRIGLAAMLETMRLMGGSCALTIIKPWPLQYTAQESEAIRQNGKTKLKGSTNDREKECAVLRQYWSQLGFARLPKSDFYVFSHAWKMPTSSEVLSGKFRLTKKPGSQTRP